MSTGNLNLDLFANEILEATENSFAISKIKKRYPSLSDKEAFEILSLIKSTTEQNDKQTVSLAITAPPSFSIRAKSTKIVVEQMIKNAEKSILITGYSLSDYFGELIDIIIQKSQSGVYVKFFINNIEKQNNIEKLLRYKGRFLDIYTYANKNDSMSALHAKVITVDGKESLITSANLSFHGQEGNIELGAFVKSESVSKQIDDIFTKLIFNKVLTRV